MVPLREYPPPELNAQASLNMARAFDSVKWLFLQSSLKKFGFGEGFKKRIKILYKTPVSSGE